MMIVQKIGNWVDSGKIDFCLVFIKSMIGKISVMLELLTRIKIHPVIYISRKIL